MRALGASLLALGLLLGLLAFGQASGDREAERQGKAVSGKVLAQWDSLPLSRDNGTGLTGKVMDGACYLGILEAPSLGLCLPVAAQWDDAQGLLTPCRYAGGPEGRFLIAGHNTRSHFRGIGELGAGDSLTFTDAGGVPCHYEVTGAEEIAGTDIPSMLSGDWDLTLFTCTYSGRSRIAVRARKTG